MSADERAQAAQRCDGEAASCARSEAKRLDREGVLWSENQLRERPQECVELVGLIAPT
jgi:hypothetical protein